MGKFKVKDKVRFIGDPYRHVDEEKLKEVYERKEILEIDFIDWAGDYEVSGYSWSFKEDELELAEPMEEITNKIIESIGQPKVDVTISYDESSITSKFVTKQYLEDYTEKCLGEFKEKEKNYMKILDIYRREAMIKIDNDYDNLVNKIIEEDKIQKLIQETENQINVILDKDENDAVCLGNRGLLEPKNKEKIREIIDSKHAEWKKLDVMLEKVAARLEICDDDEFSKVEVLKLYNILDNDGKIAEYKIEKKGKK